MDHLEPAIFPLTAQSDLVKDKGRGQIGQKPRTFSVQVGIAASGKRPDRVK